VNIRIAIFHGLGDCVNATTLIRPILTRYPGARITWITSKQYEGVVANNPYICKVITFNEAPLRCDKHIDGLRNKYQKELLLPAPYMNQPSKDRTLLGHFKELATRYGWSKPIEPLLYVTKQEIQVAKGFLRDNHISRFILLETKFSSSQSEWNQKDTIRTLQLLSRKNYTVLLTHSQDEMLAEFNVYCRTFCLDFNFRLMPVFYNCSSGFIGVSSGISCAVHTHQCRLDLPHLEFVRGKHWCTRHYHKDRKVISFDRDELDKLVTSYFL
jgi:ADP-heptose:LPS heptosyltransferase